MSPSERRMRSERSRRSGTKRLAERYVAIVTHASMPRHVIEGTRKRELFEEAKLWARQHAGLGVIVELRANSAEGGIIERVSMVPNLGTGFPHRWRQEFST